MQRVNIYKNLYRFQEVFQMITGRDTLQEINDHVLQAQSQIENADREMDNLTSHLSRLRIEEAEQFRQLARFRLDEMNAGHHGGQAGQGPSCRSGISGPAQASPGRA